jgi:protein-tyrosine phosphatase
MPNILFVCTANQFRSPFAAACLVNVLQNRFDGETWVVESAGTWAPEGAPAIASALKNAERLGLKGLARHRSRQVSISLLERYDLVIVMESGHKEALSTEFKSVRNRIFMVSEIIDGIQYDIPDPAVPGNKPDEVALELQALINKGAEKIIILARSMNSAGQNRTKIS